MNNNKNYGKNRRMEIFTNRANDKESSNKNKEHKMLHKALNSGGDRRANRKTFFNERFNNEKNANNSFSKYKKNNHSSWSNTENNSSYKNEENNFAFKKTNKDNHQESHFSRRRNTEQSYHKKNEDNSFFYSEKRRTRRFNDKPNSQNRNNKKTVRGLESDILREIISKRKQEGRHNERKSKILSLSWNEERDPIRLNKYIANSGICSRREADSLILAGAITVNGVVVTELGTKIMPTDEVRYEDKILQREKPVYILLNKPKDYITTTEDERDRNSVMTLIEGACKERVYPVGRLDRNTTGLLLFTNDGELTKKLTHPRFEIKKIYQVELDKDMTLADFETLANGIELYDGFIKPDDLAFVDGQKNILGITLHSGKNRIVRRMFGHLGYEVIKLDRVYYAGLTKKDLPRGQYRFLTQAEINILKMSL